MFNIWATKFGEPRTSVREVLWSSKLTGQTGSWYGRGNRVFISRLQDCVVSTPCCSTICGQVLKDRTLGRLHLGKVLSSLSWVRMKTAGWENIFIFIYFRYIELQFVVACNNVSSAIFASYKCSLDVRCLIVWTSKCCIIGHTTRQLVHFGEFLLIRHPYQLSDSHHHAAVPEPFECQRNTL